MARTAVSLVASVAVLAPPHAFTIETFRDGDDAASSSPSLDVITRRHQSSNDMDDDHSG